MKKIVNICFLVILVTSMVGCSTCSRTDQKDSAADEVGVRNGSKENILVGALNLAVDETVLPLVKEQEEVFLSAYPSAKLNIIAQPELLAVRELLSNEAAVGVLARELNEEENDYFKKSSIKPRIFSVFSDRIVIITNIELAH